MFATSHAKSSAGCPESMDASWLDGQTTARALEPKAATKPYLIGTALEVFKSNTAVSEVEVAGAQVHADSWRPAQTSPDRASRVQPMPGKRRATLLERTSFKMDANLPSPATIMPPSRLDKSGSSSATTDGPASRS